jgi:S1-C subfamily serine protease
MQILVACAVEVVFLTAQVFLSNPGLAQSAVRTATPELQVQTQPRSLLELYHLAQAITVQVKSSEKSGSGILIRQQAGVYSILTNEHVLQPRGKDSVQTPDGQFHAAIRLVVPGFNQKDLALLQFRSGKVYSVAAIGQMTEVMVGQAVFAAGFPGISAVKGVRKFTFTEGNIAILPEKAMQGSYQLGYTNPIQKGMSGGPVLNDRGQLIAINGVHANPLWGDPYIYQDGSKPCRPMRDLMARLSWAIPIETVSRSLPASVKLEPVRSLPFNPVLDIWKFYRDRQTTYGAILLQTTADAAKYCQPLNSTSLPSRLQNKK